MRKIPQLAESSFYNNPQLEICEHGISVTKPKYLGFKKHCKHLYGHEWKRGKITTFSRNSSRLLKEKLVRMPSIRQGYFNIGVTLTLPKDAFFDASDDSISYFHKFWRNYRQRLIDNASKGRFSEGFFLVWRIELTKNRVPHFHIICYTKDKKDVLFMSDIWLAMVKKYYNITPYRDASVKIQEITSYEGAYKYIATHSSKHKKDQLGWQGRQWGIIFPNSIAKKLLQDAFSSDIIDVRKSRKMQVMKFGYNELTFSNYFKLLRVLRKLWKNPYLASLKTHFLLTDTKVKIMRYMEC